MSHFFSQRLTVHFILSLVQTQRAAERSGGLGAWRAQAVAVAYEIPLPSSHPSAPVECLSVLSYPCMNGCKVNQLLGKPESASTKAPELTVLKHNAPALSTDPPPPLAAKLLSYFLWGGGQRAEGSGGRHTNLFCFPPQVRFVALRFTGRMSPLMLWWWISPRGRE